MGFLITIDGLDGSGKSTQSELVYRRLVQQGKKVRLVSFPNYGTPACAPVEMYLNGAYGSDPNAVNCYAASTFYAVDRYASYNLGWKQDYLDGAIILATRYTTSNAIHQAAKLESERRGEFLDWLESYEYGLLGLPRPDLTVLLEVPVEVSLSMIEKRGEKTDIHENTNHLRQAYSAAMEVSRKWDWQVVHCSGEGRMRPKESITDEILAVIASALPTE